MLLLLGCESARDDAQRAAADHRRQRHGTGGHPSEKSCVDLERGAVDQTSSLKYTVDPEVQNSTGHCASQRPPRLRWRFVTRRQRRSDGCSTLGDLAAGTPGRALVTAKHVQLSNTIKPVLWPVPPGAEQSRPRRRSIERPPRAITAMHTVHDLTRLVSRAEAWPDRGLDRMCSS